MGHLFGVPTEDGSARRRASFISGWALGAEGNEAAGHRPVSGEGTPGTEDVTGSPAGSEKRRAAAFGGSSGGLRRRCPSGARAPGREEPANNSGPARGGAERGGPGAAARPVPALSPRHRHRRRRSRVHARWSPRLPPAAPAWTFGSTPPPPPPWARCPARTPLASARWIIITATRYRGLLAGLPGSARPAEAPGTGEESAGG